MRFVNGTPACDYTDEKCQDEAVMVVLSACEENKHLNEFYLCPVHGEKCRRGIEASNLFCLKCWTENSEQNTVTSRVQALPGHTLPELVAMETTDADQSA